MLIMMKKSAISNFFITLIAIDNYLYVYKINIDSLFFKVYLQKTSVVTFVSTLVLGAVNKPGSVGYTFQPFI